MPPRHAPDMSYRPTAKGDWNTIRTLLPYLWPRGESTIRARVIAAMVCLVTAKLATVMVPVLYKEAVDLISTEGAFVVTALIGILVGYGIARVAQQGFAELRDFFFARVGQRAIRAVGLKTFRHLHSLSLRFHLDRQTGGLSRAIERGVKGIEFLLTFMLFNIVPTLLEITMVCGILWAVFDLWYALVTLVTVSLYIAFTFSVTEWRMKFRRQMNEMDSKANTRAIDSLLNYETVKYFGNEEHEASRFDSALRRYEDAAVRSKTTLALVNIGQGFIIATGLTLVMTMAGFDIQSGAMTVGGFVMVNTYLMQLFLPLNFLGFVYREIKQSLTDMEAMFRLTAEQREVVDADGAPDLVANGGTVTFRDVKFGYGPDRQILKGLSFEVPAGKTVAIVGPSGAGKSTISRLLFRFYDVTDGAIEIDGQDIRSITQDSLRKSIGIVPQDTVLFNDSVFYNIAYGRPDASPSEIEEAAKLASIHDFVMSLPDGYNTSVGERGLKLSGGEKQRVAIARTILKRPAIFLFDEATSALDSHTEKAIQRSLADVSTDRTTLTIAHRLSTIVEADEIIVLRDGAIAERGQHHDLLDRDGVYASMWREQQKAARGEGEVALGLEKTPDAVAIA
ncbi:MAG: ABC transporter ATP-binding protein/permease [Alphaproteobacteria bacterium]|nr:ABC transporter ATP-binding protein/permease [Alphaproteobacteria bacterium]